MEYTYDVIVLGSSHKKVSGGGREKFEDILIINFYIISRHEP